MDQKDPLQPGKTSRYRKSHAMTAKCEWRAIFTSLFIAFLVLLIFSRNVCSIFIPTAKRAARHHRQCQYIKGEYKSENPHCRKDSKPFRSSFQSFKIIDMIFAMSAIALPINIAYSQNRRAFESYFSGD
jgi:hypothetical protein